MDCRRFRDQHALLIDQRCSQLVERQMHEHIRACAPCAALDSSVRRSLLLARNLPDIHPSPDFLARLQHRLATGAQPTELRRPFPASGFAAVAAAVAFVTLLALGVLRQGSPVELRMEPVVAMSPEADPSVISSAVVAALPTGMSVWPAIVAATHAPVHFVATEMADER